MYGLICGLALQFLKMDLGGDYFWNIRLPLVLALGMVVFYAANWAGSKTLAYLLGRYDNEIQRRDLKTYVPLCFVLLFPVQKIGMQGYWRKPFFFYFLGVYVFAVLAMKCVLVANVKKEGKTGEEHSSRSSIGSGRLAVAALAAGVPLLWFHQFTLSFDDFFPFFRPGRPQSVFVRHNEVTRNTFFFREKIKAPVPVKYDRSIAVVGYTITKKAEVKAGNIVPIAFDLHVTDRSGAQIMQRRLTLDAADDKSGQWHDFEFPFEDKNGSLLDFSLQTRPALSQMDWSYLLGFLLHNPLDFSFFQSQSVEAAWSVPAVFPQEKRGPNVIVISLDTLRADYLGCYGFERDVSPTIDAFARENVLYKNAFSQSSWTLPSHLSMLTSRFPNELNTTHFILNFKTPAQGLKQIDETTLAEVLREDGYYCAGFTDGVFLSSYFGFHKGFHVYDETYGAEGNSFELARDWISRNKDKNFFVFIHTYLIHDYLNEDELVRQDNVETEFGELLEWVISAFPEVEDPKHFIAFRGNGESKHAYAVRIKLVDMYLREFFSFLRDEHLYDDAIIAITSDHGESFGEWHDDGHTRAILHSRTPPYDPEIHVPLLLKPPPALHDGPLVVEDDVRLLDVAPTILAMLGIDPSLQFRGNPILPGLGPDEPDVTYPFVYTTWSVPGGAIRENGKKYIFDSEKGKEEFYDLDNDPAEFHNLASEEPEGMLELRLKYNNFVSEIGGGSVTLEESVSEVPDALREKLENLGYINK